MVDVAQLGIEVSSKGADKATSDLTKLTNAAKMADTAADGLSVSTRNAGAAAAASAGGIQKAAAATKAYAVAANSNVRSMGGSMSGLAAQFQDIGVTASMGMNPLIIALQQGTQIAGQMEMAMQSGASATGVFAQAFRSLLSPVTLASIALTALAAAGLQIVNWSSVASTVLNGLANVLETIAPYAAMAAAGLALVYAPAIVGGIVSLIGLVGQLTVSVFGLAAAFVAANPAAAFVIGLTAAVAAANIFREELTQIFGVDIVGAAKTGVNYIIGSFVAAFEDIKFVWNSLPNIVGAAAIGAANAVIRAVNHMINGAKMAINDLIAAINMIPGVDIGALDTSGGAISELDNAFAASLAEGVNARNAAVQAALSHDYIGQIGGAIQTAASTGKTALQDLAASITGVGVEGEKAGGRAAGGMDKVKAATEKASEAMNWAKDATKGFLSDLRSGLQNGEGFWKSFGNAALNVLDKIISKIEDQLVEALFSAGSATSGLGGGGGGGFLGAIFGGIGKIFGFASGGYTGSRAANAVAGVVHGGEYVFSKRATDRIGVGNLEAMHRSAKGYASGGYVAPVAANQNGPASIHITFDARSYFDDNGNLETKIEKVSAKQVNKAAPGIVNAAKQQAVPAVAEYQANVAGAEWR